MAAWQFVIDLIPTSWVVDDGDFRSLLADDLAAMELTWSKVELNLDDVVSSIGFLKPTTSWHSSLKVWGDVE